MLRLEALRTELEAVHVENQRLQVENACLSKQASDGEEGRQDSRVTQLENERDQLAGEC